MDIFEIENPPITAQDLSAFETETGLLFPEDYRLHLLQYNGGNTISMDIYFGEPDDGINLLYFYPLKHGDSLMVEPSDYLPAKHISIGATSTGYLAMSLHEENYGSIYVHYSEAILKFLAPSFTEFIAGLIDYETWI